MDDHGILEVITPVLSHHATTDPHVPSVRTADGKFLHTSPEFAMKRLLAAQAMDCRPESSEHCTASGSEQSDIYQITPVFRAGESGRFHNTEFTLLEWYRLGMNHHALMGDMEALLASLHEVFALPWHGVDRRRYGVEVRQRLGVWPEAVTVAMIESYFVSFNRSFPASLGDDTDAALDLFMDEFVLPEFSTTRYTFLQDYPVSQAALARLGMDEDARQVAERFELYLGRVELANGFHELGDASVQKSRFEQDLQKRAERGIDVVPMDAHLIDALDAGFPDCAGVALGLERLHMVLGGHDHISQVVSFDDQRA